MNHAMLCCVVCVDSHQRFFRALCIALKVPRAVEISKEALSSGHCVVIGLQSTGQSGVEHHRDVASSNDQTPATDTLEFVSTPAVILQRLVKKLFPLPGLSRPSIPLAPIDSIDIDCKRPRRVTASKAISYAYPTNDEFAVPIGESEDEEEDVRLLSAAVSKKRPLRAQASSSMAQSLQSVPNPSSTVRRPPAHGTTKDGINGWSIFHSEGWTLAPMDRLPGSEHIGKAVLKRFRNAQCVDGDVVAFLPAAANEGMSLWHVVWSDGDEEDWDDTEVRSIGVCFHYSNDWLQCMSMMYLRCGSASSCSLIRSLVSAQLLRSPPDGRRRVNLRLRRSPLSRLKGAMLMSKTAAAAPDPRVASTMRNLRWAILQRRRLSKLCRRSGTTSWPRSRRWTCRGTPWTCWSTSWADPLRWRR